MNWSDVALSIVGIMIVSYVLWAVYRCRRYSIEKEDYGKVQKFLLRLVTVSLLTIMLICIKTLVFLGSENTEVIQGYEYVSRSGGGAAAHRSSTTKIVVLMVDGEQRKLHLQDVRIMNPSGKTLRKERWKPQYKIE